MQWSTIRAAIACSCLVDEMRPSSSSTSFGNGALQATHVGRECQTRVRGPRPAGAPFLSTMLIAAELSYSAVKSSTLRGHPVSSYVRLGTLGLSLGVGS